MIRFSEKAWEAVAVTRPATETEINNQNRCTRRIRQRKHTAPQEHICHSLKADAIATIPDIDCEVAKFCIAWKRALKYAFYFDTKLVLISEFKTY